MTLRNWLFDGMSSPLVGSSISFVHKQQLGVGRQREAHVHFLLLSHGKLLQVDVRCQLEVAQTALQHLAAEARIERPVELHVCLEGHRSEVELLGNEEYLLKRFRLMAARVNAVYGDGACRPAQQSADKVKQCRLTRAVLSQQSVDVIVLKVEAEAVEDVLLRALVLVFQVLDVYHFIVVFRFLFYRKLNESGGVKGVKDNTLAVCW